MRSSALKNGRPTVWGSEKWSLFYIQKWSISLPHTVLIESSNAKVSTDIKNIYYDIFQGNWSARLDFLATYAAVNLGNISYEYQTL